MQTSRLSLALSAAALAVSVGLGLAWGIGLTGAGPVARWVLLTCCGVAAGTAGVLVWRRESASRRMLEQHLARFTNVDHHDLVAQSRQPLSAVPVPASWRGLVGAIERSLDLLANRLREAEHNRAAAEIRARRATKRSEQIEQVLAGMPEPIIAIDQFDDLVLANPSAERLFQFDCRSAGERALGELVRCEKLIELLTDVRRRKSPATRTAELCLSDPDPDGDPLHAGQGSAARWYSVTARGFTAGEANRPLGAVAVLRDISVQKVVQQRNAEFVSAVSHEMKTPLAGIKAYVELLADGDAEDEATREEFISVINSQADRLQRLIDNLLNLARIEAGVVNVNKQPQSLNDLLEETLHLVQPAAEQKNIRLQSDLSGMYLGVLVDRDMAMQAAINLLSNAVKYTPSGGTVTLRSRTEGNYIQFEVEDTGVGLSEEDCTKVFQKFYRVKKDQQMASGTGLGLPLAKHIVEDVHGGSLTLESQLGVGSRFIVALPKYTAKEPAAV
jgi:two-component system, OmpR family, phosphate regulon sensor histidine kinase PhoR